jgi:hypothetical protein
MSIYPLAEELLAEADAALSMNALDKLRHQS